MYAVEPHAADSDMTHAGLTSSVVRVTSDNLTPTIANSVSRNIELSKANTHSLKPEP